MALMIVILFAFLETVMAATTPVSVHLGDNATFSWPLPASAQGKLVLVVGPTGARVLSWAPDCTTPFSDFADRVRSSCKDASQVTFTLLGVRWPDEGSYRCEAVSSFWSSRIEDCGQELTVIKDRPFPQPEVSHYGIPVLGQPFSMSCECTRGCPHPEHILRSQWFKDSVELPETSLVLRIPHVTEQDDGAYTCRIIGSRPETTSPVSLRVNFVALLSPQVHIEVTTPDAVAGEVYLTLTCVVTAAYPKVPGDGYSWSYLPSPQGQLRPLLGKTRTLTLGPLTMEDRGQYFCQARNDEGFQWTRIPPGNASFSLTSSCITVWLGLEVPSQALLERNGDGYKAMFEVSWYDELIEIQHPNTSIIANWHPPCHFDVTAAFQQRVTNTSCDPCKRTLSFSLSSLTERDLGRYQCYAATTHGTKVDSYSVELITKVSPQVHIQPATPDTVVKATAGKSMTLTCVVTEGFPPVPKDGYSWSYLPSPQGQPRPLVGKTRTLTLGPVTREDRGQYFCQASNDQDNRWNLPPGHASVTVDVSFLGRIISTSNLKVNEGDHVTLTCSVDSNPAARLAWVVEGQEVRHVTANVDHYVVERAACSDSKTYTCRASNPDLPGLERTTSTTLTVNCGQADTSSQVQVSMLTTTALAALLGSFLASLLVFIAAFVSWKRCKGRHLSRDSTKLQPPGEVESPPQTSACGQEEDVDSPSGSCSSNEPLLHTCLQKSEDFSTSSPDV